MDKSTAFKDGAFLDFLMKPSVALMMRLTFTMKSVILAIIVAIAIATITITLFQRLYHEIEITKQELKGLDFYPDLFKIIQLTQKHRGASAGASGIGGNRVLFDQLSTLEQKITLTILHVQKKLPFDTSMGMEWDKIHFEWLAILDDGMNLSMDTHFKRHILLIDLTRKLVSNLSDMHQLTNSSHIGTYFLINTATSSLLPAQENLGQIRGFGTGMLINQYASKEQQLKISNLVFIARDAIKKFDEGLNKIELYNPNINLNRINANQINHDTQQILNKIESNIKHEQFNIDPLVFFNSMSEQIDHNYSILYETLIPTTRSLIEARKAKAEYILQASGAILGLMFLTLLYLSTGIYIATKKSMKIITTATASFSKGELNQRINFNFINEFHPIAKAINTMADNLSSLLSAEKQAAARMHAIVNASQDALVQMNEQGEIIGWNHTAEAIFGWPTNEVMGQPLHNFIIPTRYRDAHITGLKNFLKYKQGSALNTLIEIEALHHDGHEFSIELTISPIKIGEIYEFSAFIRDISNRKKAENKAQLSTLVFQAAHEGIMVTDPAGIIIDVNPAVCEFSGYSRNEIIGNRPSLFSSGRQSAEFYREMWSTIKHLGYWQGELWNRRKNGDLYAELLNISSILDDDGKVLHYVGMFADITENKQQKETLQQLAHYDSLTHLPNRTLFIDRFRQASAHSKRTSTQLAICFLDLDDFKPVNDEYGHDVGDELLIEVSKRIQAILREEDTVSRQGGDEFALLIGEVQSLDECKKMISRLHSSLARPYIINDSVITIGASSGITLYPSDNADLDTLMRHADKAMYQAKLEGKNRYHLFNAEHDKEIIQKIDRLNEIEQAIKSNQLSMYYQPKVKMSTGNVFGVEALIRWHHPEKGLVAPLEFLPVLDGMSLEIVLGEWVIWQSLKQLDIWHKQGIDLEMSINISSYHLQSENFIPIIKKALELYPDIPPQKLQLEILESSALSDISIISRIIQYCQDELNIGVALDDFGTGYSSLTHMRNLPAQTIKIDQSFVRDMLEDPHDYSIINGIISLAESFNREVIAEGVETTQHGLMLQLMGCENAQGYCIARPMPADRVVTWLKDYIPNPEWLANDRNKIATERNIQLLKLTVEYWFEDIKSKLSLLQNNRQAFTTSRTTSSHFSVWIKRIKKEELFSNEWLDLLTHKHEVMSQLGNGLIDKYGKIEFIAQEVEKLDLAYTSVLAHLEKC